ncbi:MAG TPA: protein kinase [Urbifossiella sp.]|nr:protein kinase [Urbifossiella sp.]
MAREVAEGLAAAHAAGLVHRDIKPANIWLEGDPGGPVRRCKALDFGLARPADAAGAQVTASGAVLGTPAYMAPEQARGVEVNARADLFSLGITLYRTAAGRAARRRWRCSSRSPQSRPRRSARSPPATPPDLADLIGRLMAKEPALRPRSAARSPPPAA